MRSLWKGFFINNNYVNNLNNVILKNIVNKLLIVNNGRKNSNILIKTNMLFLKIGSLVFTRKVGVKHKKKEKKKIGKKK